MLQKIHMTYAYLQNPDRGKGQIPRVRPHLIKFRDPQKAGNRMAATAANSRKAEPGVKQFKEWDDSWGLTPDNE